MPPTSLMTGIATFSENRIMKPTARGIGATLLAALLGFCIGAPAASRPLVSADDWVGLWRGTYVCAQGVTGLFLTVSRSGQREVTAVFKFFAVPENPGVPTGEFDMTGRLGPQGNHLRLSPDGWIARPPGYLTVELEGDYDDASGEYSGQVWGWGCTRFILRRDAVG